MPFALSWIGNDGTFAGPASVTLPLGAPVAVPVTVNATTEGAHTAILSIEHPSVPAPVHRVLTAIVVPHRFTAEGGFSVTAEITPPLPGDLGVFVEVPPGVEALQFFPSSPSVGLTAVSPDREMLNACPFKPEGTTEPCTVVRPQPGVWEINASHARFAFNFDPAAPVPLKAEPVSITATLLGVDATPAERPPQSVAVGGAQPLTLELTNRLASVTAAAAAVELASASQARGMIGEDEQRVHEVIVPEGATSLYAAVSVSDPAADVDVYLLDCSVPEEKPAAPPKSWRRATRRRPLRRRSARRRPRPQMSEPAVRSRSRARRPGGGWWWSTATRSRTGRSSTRSSTSSPTRPWARSRSPTVPSRAPRRARGRRKPTRGSRRSPSRRAGSPAGWPPPVRRSLAPAGCSGGPVLPGCPGLHPDLAVGPRAMTMSRRCDPGGPSANSTKEEERCHDVP